MRNSPVLRASTATAEAAPRSGVRALKPVNTAAKRTREHKLGATARSFAILDHVAASPKPVDVLDIIASLKLPKATAYRLVDWFVCHGYLSREPGRKRLIVGPKLTNLAFGVLSASMRNDAPHLVLQRLVRELNETCNIGTLLNGEVIYLDRVEA
jgi:DNA-binding IclR family transcriptional regulator